ncbi:glycerophosphoryl diester phosphodiesterase [Cellvibrio zantedeschiae]|uniref:Glycerophosphoryl diester phosphodiesterase n=2 Tax=Cellvibrio zantedeschiae TaxID=1237077 RepID=A0ABQ3BAJ2_9GAMM|nr:glycerophosphoryl diester phosphodiesterase [Cellvibrio zantedeschiae]
MTCIAHRGGPLMNNQPLPENSLAAIARALDAGVDAVEIDIYQVEGELLVTHDRRLGRVVSGQGIITDLPLAYLREQKLENGELLPTLRDVLALVKDRALLNIEIKGLNCVPTLKQQLEAFAHDHQLGLDHYIVSSFDHQQLFESLQLIPAIKRAALIEGIPLDYAQCCEPLKAYAFNTHLSFITPNLIDDARKRGLKNWVYTVNHEDDWAWLAQLGVDGVFTDKPDRLQNFTLTH